MWGRNNLPRWYLVKLNNVSPPPPRSCFLQEDLKVNPPLKKGVDSSLIYLGWYTIWVEKPKNSGFSPPQIIHFYRVFHEINHPFWWFSPFFWKHPYEHQKYGTTLGVLDSLPCLRKKSQRCSPNRHLLRRNVSSKKHPQEPILIFVPNVRNINLHVTFTVNSIQNVDKYFIGRAPGVYINI